MTTLREAAQQALEALEKLVVGSEYEEAVEAERAMDALRAALAESVQPVAWTYEWKHRLHGGSLNVSRARWPESHLWIETPLYAAPPQRKPLTEEEIDSIWDSEKAFADIYAIVRAIERAHGIDGAPEERNFCSRCGKRTNGIHTCTPPAPLTDEVIADLWHQNGGFHHHFARAIERWLRGHA